MSILSGIENHVDEWLKTAAKGKPPYYRHRAAANELTRRNTAITGTLEFLDTCYSQIHENWLGAIDAGYSKPSRENWRWKRHLNLSPQNKSPELRLERAIVNACGENWSNQMPTASGLVGSAANKRAAVDLVYRHDSETYSLIELKVNGDNPLFAAIEILIYGLLLVWSRNNQEKLGYDRQVQPVLTANNVTLVVLAPNVYYEKFDLTNLASALNDGLDLFGQQNDMELRFEFRRLGMDYQPSLEPESIRSAIAAGSRVWGV